MRCKLKTSVTALCTVICSFHLRSHDCLPDQLRKSILAAASHTNTPNNTVLLLLWHTVVGTRCHFVCCLFFRVGVRFAWLCFCAAGHMRGDDGSLRRCHWWVSALYHRSTSCLGLCRRSNSVWTCAGCQCDCFTGGDVRSSFCLIIYETAHCRKNNRKRWVRHLRSLVWRLGMMEAINTGSVISVVTMVISETATRHKRLEFMFFIFIILIIKTCSPIRVIILH